MLTVNHYYLKFNYQSYYEGLILGVHKSFCFQAKTCNNPQVRSFNRTDLTSDFSMRFCTST